MNKKFKNLKIGRKLTLSFSITLLLLLVSMLISIFSLLSLNKKVNTFYDGIYSLKSLSSELSLKYERVQKFIFLALSSHSQEETEAYVTTATEAGDSIPETLVQIKKIYAGNPELLSELEANLGAVTPIRKEVSALTLEMKNEEAHTLTVDKWIPAIQTALGSIDKLSAYADEEGTAMIMQLRRSKIGRASCRERV